MVMPFVYMLAASFKYNHEIYELSLLPREPTLDNYRRLFERSGFLRWFMNSLLIGTVTTASVLFFVGFFEAVPSMSGGLVGGLSVTPEATGFCSVVT